LSVNIRKTEEKLEKREAELRGAQTIRFCIPQSNWNQLQEVGIVT
jgi:hypothetical protein